MKTTYGLFIALALALGTFAGKADTIVNLNTGVDGSGAQVPTGDPDPRWTVVPPWLAPAPQVTVDGVPPYPSYSWGSARVITPASILGGSYTYEIQFSITKVAGLTYSLSAAAWANYSIQAVSFGETGSTLTGLTLVPGAGNFVTFVASDQSLFETGPKTLRLTVFNDDIFGDTRMALAGAVTAVPEASEWAMLIGAAGLGLLFYRKQLIALMQREAPAAA